MGDAPDQLVIKSDVIADVARNNGTAELYSPAGLDLPGPRRPDASEARDRANFDWGPLKRHPRLIRIVEALIADHDKHPLDFVNALKDPRTRQGALKILAECADGVSQGVDALRSKLMDADRSKQSLLLPVPASVNYFPDGTSRKDVVVAQAAEEDRERFGGLLVVNDEITEAKDLPPAILKYSAWLYFAVHTRVEAEIENLAALFPGAKATSRSKNAGGLLDKVKRMQQGAEGRPPRENYQIRDVIDGVGARITVADTRQLQDIFDAFQEKYADGKQGQILEIQNSYATPKEHNPHYRLVTLIIKDEISNYPHTYELQLQTKRAAVIADLEHNTVYKPHIEISDEDKKFIRQMQEVAGLLDLAELVGYRPNRAH